MRHTRDGESVLAKPETAKAHDGPGREAGETHYVTWVTERQEPTSPEKLISDVSQLA